MDDPIEPYEPAAARAMHAVLAGRADATDAWLAYVRIVHPDAVDALARAAVSCLAIDLLLEHGDLDEEEAARQRAEVAATAAGAVSRRTWISISDLRETLDLLAAHAERTGIVELEDEAMLDRRIS